MPLVAPPIASFTPPLLIRLTDAPLPLTLVLMVLPPAPPIAVPDTVTVPPVAELPKTAGPRPPLDKVAEPPLAPAPPRDAASASACCDGRDRGLIASYTACLGVCATCTAANAAETATDATDYATGSSISSRGD